MAIQAQPEVRSQARGVVELGEEVRLVDRRDRLLPVRELEPAEVDRVAVQRDRPCDLPEGERHDGYVVAAKPQRREADDRAGDRGQHHGDEDDQEEVQVDAGQRGGLTANRDVGAAVARDRGEPVGPEPPDRVGADRVKRHVAEVEQPRKAHDDVEAEREDDVRDRVDRGVERASERRQEQREDRGQRDRDRAGHEGEVTLPAQLAEGVAHVRERAHPASRVSSPSRPWGRKTMTRIR